MVGKLLPTDIYIFQGWCGVSTKQYAVDQVLTDVHSPGRFRYIQTSLFILYSKIFFAIEVEMLIFFMDFILSSSIALSAYICCLFMVWCDTFKETFN